MPARRAPPAVPPLPSSLPRSRPAPPAGCTRRYEALAAEMAEAIRRGALRPGDRLPSVRAACASHRCSPATVFQAYYRLEAEGLVRARERSGYYVTEAAPAAALPEPERPSQPPAQAGPLDVSAQVFEILEATLAREVVPLGSAFPSPLLFPLPRLGRLAAGALQRLDPWTTIDDLGPGDPDLRRQIARRHCAEGLAVAPGEVLITHGALEALNLCLAAVTRPGDKVLIESPTFYAALHALERLGLEAVEVPTHPREGIELDALEQAIARHRPAACWLMTSFQNPLGFLMPEAKKRALVECLRRHQLPLIEDDVYAELHFGPTRPRPAKAFDTEGLVLHCGSFSKCLAPGYRIGWTLAGRWQQAVARLRLGSTLGASMPAQLAIAAYLEGGGYDKHLRSLRRRLALQQAQLAEAVAQHFPPGCRATRPAGGYFLWIEMPEGVDALALHRRALAAGISLAPGPIFSARRGFRHCIRLNAGHGDAAREGPALATLGRWMAEMAAAAGR